MDPDLLALEKTDRVNLEFDLLNYNVDKNTEISRGSQSISILTDAKKMGEMFANPASIPLTVMSIIVFLLMIVCILLLCFYTWFKFIRPNEEKSDQLFKVIFYSSGMLLLLVFFYYMYNKVNRESNLLINIVTQSNKKMQS